MEKMKAAIYKTNAPQGILVKKVPKPDGQKTTYTPSDESFLKRNIKFILSFIHFFFFRPLFFFTTFFTPKTDLITIKVKYAGINPVDAKFLYGDKLPHIFKFFVKWVVQYNICGFDFSGIVEDAPLSSGFKKGDEVYGTTPPLSGTLCEYLVVPVHHVALKPKNLSFAESSVLPLAGLTVIQSFEEIVLVKEGTENKNILVIGASGGVGHIALQIAKEYGCRVIAICGSRSNDFVLKLGADKVFNYDENGFDVGLLEKDVEENGKFDLVIDTVSSNDEVDAKYDYESKIMKANILKKKIKEKVQYVVYGGSFKDWVFAHIKRFFKVNLFPFGKLLFWVRFPHSSGYLNILSSLCDNGKVKPKISKEYSFSSEGVQNAFKDIIERRTKGKLCVQIS